MKQVPIIIALNLVSILCVSVSAYMVIHGIGHWGWFFALGAISAHGIKEK